MEKEYKHFWISPGNIPEVLVDYTNPVLARKKNWKIDSGIRVEHPGIYKGFEEDESGTKILGLILHLKDIGIHYFAFETSSILFFWDNNGYKPFWTSD